MAAPAVNAASAASGTNGSAPAPPIPGTPQAGDWMLAFFHSREVTDGTVSLSAGWDSRINTRGTGGCLAVFTRAWVSGDAAPTWTLGGHTTGTTGDSAVAQILLLRPSASGTIAWGGAGTVEHFAASSTQVGPISGIAIPTNARVFVLGGFLETATAWATLSGDGLTWQEDSQNSNSNGADNACAIDSADDTAGTDTTAKTFALTTTGGTVASCGVQFYMTETPPVSLTIPIRKAKQKPTSGVQSAGAVYGA